MTGSILIPAAASGFHGDDRLFRAVIRFMSRLFVVPLIVVILIAAPGATGARTAVLPAGVNLSYEVHAGGFIVADGKFRVDLGGDRFNAGIVIQPRGIPALLKEFRLRSQVNGLLTSQGIEPRYYRSEYWKEQRRRRWVAIDYAGTSIPRVEAVPTAREDERTEVPRALRGDSLDPVTAALALSDQIGRNGRCAGRLDVYDGRRLFRLELDHLKFVEVEAPFNGEEPVAGIKCRMNVTKVSGFEDKERKSNRYPDDMTLYLTPVTSNGLWLPVRIEAKHFLGSLVVRLVSVEDQSVRGQRASRSSKPASPAPLGVGSDR